MGSNVRKSTLSASHYSHKCILIPTRKFQKNACTQYALEQLTEEEKESILQSESLKVFMNSVTPRYNNPSCTVSWLHTINRTTWTTMHVCVLGRWKIFSRRWSWTCSEMTVNLWRPWPNTTTGLERLPKIWWFIKISSTRNTPRTGKSAALTGIQPSRVNLKGCWRKRPSGTETQSDARVRFLEVTLEAANFGLKCF